MRKITGVSIALPMSCLGCYYNKFTPNKGKWEASHIMGHGWKRIVHGTFKTQIEALECTVAWEKAHGRINTPAQIELIKQSKGAA